MPTPRDLSAHRAVRRLPVGDHSEVLVDLHEGELIVRQLDLVVAGTTGHLRLVREYRSHSPVERGFGPGWSYSAGPGFEPDTGGEPETFTDARGRVVTLHRDSGGLVSKVVDPLGAGAASFAYDRSGRAGAAHRARRGHHRLPLGRGRAPGGHHRSARRRRGDRL